MQPNKKKVLFIIRDFEHGGIGRVLLNLLDRVDNKIIDANILVCNPTGIFAEQMKKHKILPQILLLKLLSCNYRKEYGLMRSGGIVIKFLRHLLLHITRKDVLLDAVEKYAARKLTGVYDVVWACSEDTPAHIAQKMCTKKVLWIHNHYTSCYNQIQAIGFPDYESFDKIICVSDDASIVLAKMLKEKNNIDLSGKIQTIYNIVNDAEIQNKASEKIKDERFKTNSFVIISIGRYAPEKNFESIPQIASRLRKKGKCFVWYIVGGGSPVMTQLIEREIQKEGIADSVILLGVKSNPYPYLAQANLFVLTSRYETYPTVINEARALGVPVVSSNFLGVEEIVEATDGWICPIEKMADKIDEIIFDHMQNVNCVVSHKKDFSAHNSEIINRFAQLMFSLEN